MDFKANYLEFCPGPKAGRTTWGKPLQKYLDRAAAWSKMGLGLAWTAVVYNTFIFPVLSFVIQLCPLSMDWDKMEGKVLRTLVSGPSCWVMPADLNWLVEHWHMPASFSSLKIIGYAARLRVRARKAAGKGGFTSSPGSGCSSTPGSIRTTW